MKRRLAGIALSFTSFLVAIGGVARSADAQLAYQEVASGLSNPVAFVQVPGDATAQVILEQGGRVRLLKDGLVQNADFLDLSGSVLSDGERGLLGLAFSPDYVNDGRVFVFLVDTFGRSVLARFERALSDPYTVDPATRFDFVWPSGLPYIDRLSNTHYGGQLGFGPDGFLYVGLGDGDWSNDPAHQAQDPQLLHGKMLRLDVGVPAWDAEGYDVPASNPFAGRPDVLGEIWAFGLRNPWRWSFDSPEFGGTGALIIGDVGQDGWEEINYEPAGAGGRNYGWRNREGARDYIIDLPPVFEPLTDPMLELDHNVASSLIGGVVYRGSALGSSSYGRYFFGDFIASRVWSVAIGTDSAGEGYATGFQQHDELNGAAQGISSFGTDMSGELYLVSRATGRVLRVIPGGPVTPTDGCITPDPFVNLGGGTCVNGGWLPPGAVPAALPPPSSGGCATPDPFTAIGGGSCVDGGWLPPGMASPLPLSPAPAPPPAPLPPLSGGCTTPDPFIAIGGGACVDGGWLPPGMAPSPPLSPAPSPAPASTPAPPPPLSGGCTTPDPFIAMGGGACVDGGWLPPGMAPPPPLSPAPSSAPAPTPAPPPPLSGGCTTPDPFIAMGGGACVDGGWLPPGMAPPPPLSPAPSPAPAPTPAPPPPLSGGCTTPDPFIAMGGGACVDGGWLPPGMAPPPPVFPAPSPAPLPPSSGGCATPDPFTAMGGGTCIDGGWLPPGMMPPPVAPVSVRATSTAMVRVT